MLQILTYNVCTSSNCTQKIITTHKVVVAKSVVIMVIGITLEIIRNEAWDDYRILKVQSRSQL